ncbi:MAG: nucleotide exchange factor GrpE [Nitrosomonadales bacterium]|nr:MAG: nucleotide exchange factor GrpE [Nitrosomonadales bacterium]
MQDEQPTLEQHEEAAQTSSAAEEGKIETMPSMEELLKQAELTAQEHHDAWLRAKADAENIRKRAQTDVANAQKYAVESFSSELLAVKDSLEAALAVETATIESLKSGVELTLKQLVSAFEKSSITELNPAGEKFDPHKHQAISMVDSDAEPNTVVTVLQKGYQLHDRILRPALVMVAKGREA